MSATDNGEGAGGNGGETSVQAHATDSAITTKQVRTSSSSSSGSLGVSQPASRSDRAATGLLLSLPVTHTIIASPCVWLCSDESAADGGDADAAGGERRRSSSRAVESSRQAAAGPAVAHATGGVTPAVTLVSRGCTCAEVGRRRRHSKCGMESLPLTMHRCSGSPCRLFRYLRCLSVRLSGSAHGAAERSSQGARVPQGNERCQCSSRGHT